MRTNSSGASPFSFLLVALVQLGVLTQTATAAQEQPSLLTIAVTAAQVSELSERDSLVAGMLQAGELVLQSARDDRLLAGRRHQNFGQYHQGIPVYGGSVSRQTSNGVTVSLFGTLYRGIDIGTTPAVSPEAVTAMLQGVSGGRLAGGITPIPGRASESGRHLHARVPSHDD